MPEFAFKGIRDANGKVTVEVWRSDTLVARVSGDIEGRHLRITSPFLKNDEQIDVKKLDPGVVDIKDLL
jgi:hypothetical protein